MNSRLQVLLGHLNALEAQVEVCLAQVRILRHALGEPEVSHEPDLPFQCRQVPEHLCARRSDEARVDVGGMGGAAAHWVCRGCGEEM